MTAISPPRSFFFSFFTGAGIHVNTHVEVHDRVMLPAGWAAL